MKQKQTQTNQNKSFPQPVNFDLLPSCHHQIKMMNCYPFPQLGCCAFFSPQKLVLSNFIVQDLFIQFICISGDIGYIWQYDIDIKKAEFRYPRGTPCLELSILGSVPQNLVRFLSILFSQLFAVRRMGVRNVPFKNVNIVIFILTLYFLYLKRLTKHKHRYLK